MKQQSLFFIVLLSVIFASCRMASGDKLSQDNEKEISVVRYDKLLNEYVHSNSFSALQKLNMEYRQPTKILIEEVLGLGQVNDDTISQKLKTFYSDTTLLRLMEDVGKKHPNLDDVEKGLNEGFKNLKKELPEINIPVVYALISAFNESIVLSDTLLGISLDKYMGEDYSLYKRFYYDYQCRSMRVERIIPDCFVFYLRSQYPHPLKENVTLLDCMLHAGKINYVVQQILDYNSVGMTIGYSEEEEKWCVANEKKIWSYMLQNNHLYVRDPMVIHKYMRPAPFTAFFGDEAPALIGAWIGNRIVEKYMHQHKDVNIQQLLETIDYWRVFKESGYLNE